MCKEGWFWLYSNGTGQALYSNDTSMMKPGMTVETLRDGAEDAVCRTTGMRDGAQADTKDLMAKSNFSVISWINEGVELEKKRYTVNIKNEVMWLDI